VRLELDRRSCCPEDADELVIFLWKEKLFMV
jgi:hypothetical protein